MKKLLLLLTFFFIFTLSAFTQISSAQKLIITITDNWDSNSGTVFLFDRSKDSWKKQLTEIRVSIGDSGLAWGIGVHPPQSGVHIKKEGDMRSPAGIFELDSVFYGLEPRGPEGVRYPYRPLTELTRCVDDSSSKSYNRIVEEDSLKKDWNSAERMQKVDPDYKYVLVVRHNPQHEKGKGSCIFIHTNNIPTSGCTSMDEEDMLSLLHWLDPKRTTLVIQLPYPEYHRLQKEWNLPMLFNN